MDLATPYFLVFFALCFGYFTLFHYLSGQTPGKMLFDVRVEGVEQTGITLAQAFLRCAGGLIALLPAGLGFLSIVLDEEQRGWNDRLAGCRVVMVEELEGD
ncbi:MAG: RDD family protein [Desulfuromonadaceae bacterium]|nr:RDD family protein [Desulfuromonadaceae bacterium]